LQNVYSTNRGREKEVCWVTGGRSEGHRACLKQMQSMVPSMVGQMNGIPTRRTVMPSGEGGEEMLHAKMAFKGDAYSLNVWIQHCHVQPQVLANNSVVGVNAQFQNGVAERRIRDLSDRERTSLFHAKERGSKAISVCLWPYEVRHRNEVHKATQKISKRASPIEISLSTTIQPQLKHFCIPTYRLNSRLQGGKDQTEWEQ
jgi:hypothetical protein